MPAPDTDETWAPRFRRFWGNTSDFALRARKLGWVDLLVVAGLVGLVFGFIDVESEWTGTLRPTVEIDLSLRALPRYALFSLSRGILAYALSFTFTLLYGYWAAKDRRAERILVPLLDILQSIPVLGFMPGLVLALVAIFPSSNAGLELAAVLMIFTAQAWNLTFSLYHSLRSIPREQNEVATLYRLDWWQRMKWVELPFATTGLVWNSMMSMAGGWFFLMINESFVLGTKDFRLPGLGSYMSVAVARGDSRAMVFAVATMMGMILLLDQIVWRPLVVWAQRFRVEESGAQEAMSSWFLTWLRRSRIVAAAREALSRLTIRTSVRTLTDGNVGDRPLPPAAGAVFSLGAFVVLLGVLLFGAQRIFVILRPVSAAQWGACSLAAGLTLMRVIASTAIGTLWALPAGLAIGLSPRASRLLQPAVQVLASFPAPMLFPAAIAVLTIAGVGLGAGSIVLMLLGTQWYILFNVIAGAVSVPADLREAAVSYRFGRWDRFRNVYFPSVFPFLVTGWVTAAGGAWNASIVSEYVTYRGNVLTTRGLGAEISRAAEAADFPRLAASVVVMSVVVIVFNRTVWRRLYRLAEERFSLTR